MAGGSFPVIYVIIIYHIKRKKKRGKRKRDSGFSGSGEAPPSITPKPPIITAFSKGCPASSPIAESYRFSRRSP
jgi:hypothetical protein